MYEFLMRLLGRKGTDPEQLAVDLACLQGLSIKLEERPEWRRVSST